MIKTVSAESNKINICQWSTKLQPQQVKQTSKKISKRKKKEKKKREKKEVSFRSGRCKIVVHESIHNYYIWYFTSTLKKKKKKPVENLWSIINGGSNGAGHSRKMVSKVTFMQTLTMKQRATSTTSPYKHIRTCKQVSWWLDFNVMWNT